MLQFMKMVLLPQDLVEDLQYIIWLEHHMPEFIQHPHSRFVLNNILDNKFLGSIL